MKRRAYRAQCTKRIYRTTEVSIVYDIHDLLKAYYKVALKRFIDNVANPVVKRILLGPEGPLAIFTPLWASKLSEEEKGGIVGGGRGRGKEARRELEGRIERLEGARRVCGGGGGVRGWAIVEI